MSTIKRKASTSPAPSATSQDAAIIDIQEPAQHLQPPHKRTALSTSTKGALRNLPLKTLETLLPLQKKQCLYTLVGGLPPVPSTSISTFSSKDQRVASTLTLAPSNEADDNADADASVFNPTSSITTKDKVNDDVRTAASVCVGLEEEWYNLHTMLHATVVNAESNSALLIGAAGSGKSLLVDSVLRSISQQVTSSKNSTRAPGGGGGGNEKPYYHVHLAGSIQINDRSAMKEMAQQLILQGAFTEDDVSDAMDEQQQSLSNQEDPSSTQRTGGADHVFGGDSSDDDDDDTPANLLTQNDNEEAEIQDELANAILSSLNNIIGHIINLLSSNTTKDSKTSRKPLLITLDNFDLFTARPRQAMLYCLLDAVQAASYGAGLAVVGMTGRVDSVDLLEKRVKSRFSHRILHVRPPSSFNVFERILRNALAPLSSPLEEKYRSKMGEGQVQNFVAAWEKDVASLFDNVHFKEVLKGVYELGNDVRMAFRIVVPTLSSMSVLEPIFSLPALLSTVSTEVGEGMLHVLRDLTEPEMALLIAVKHLQTRDRQVFNFEMCFDELRRFAARDGRERQAVSTGAKRLNHIIDDKGNDNEIDDDDADGGGGGDVGNDGILSGSAVSTPFYADRKIALMCFHSLVLLEIFLPENHVSTLTIANPVARPSVSSSPFASMGRSNQNTIRKEFCKVRCILSTFNILQAVKDKSRSLPLSSSLVKWASSHG